MYKILTQILPVSHRLRPAGNYKKTSITMHSTGNPDSTPYGERAWLDNSTNKRYAAWHFVVGEGVVIQAIPENEEAWHCGDSFGNKHSLGIEIIESGDRLKVLQTAAEFTANLLRSYGFGVDKLKRHYDWTGKNCPRILIDKNYIKNGLNWAWFVETVKSYLEPKETEITAKIEKILMVVNGQEVETRRIMVNGNNYIHLRDLAGVLDYEISNKGSIPVLTKKAQN